MLLGVGEFKKRRLKLLVRMMKGGIDRPAACILYLNFFKSGINILYFVPVLATNILPTNN
jgi:hypothetical protein